MFLRTRPDCLDILSLLQADVSLNLLSSFNLKLCADHCRFKEDGVVKYLEAAQQLKEPERSTLEVSFDDVEKYNQNLATTIIEEYYRSELLK